MKLISILSLFIFLFISISINSQQKDEYDIKAEFVKYSPEKITLNNPVIFTYRIENCGKSEIPAKSYDVEFYIDNKLVNSDYATKKLKM